MNRSNDPYDRSVRSINNSDSYEFTGESEYSRERSDPFEMIDYMIDRGVDYRGMGPKGFTLSDDRIREDVCEILARDTQIDATEIEVTVHEGVVFLRGQVESRQVKRLAEISVENLPGVSDVINQLSFR